MECGGREGLEAGDGRLTREGEHKGREIGAQRVQTLAGGRALNDHGSHY